jgi:hypothetical protein
MSRALRIKDFPEYYVTDTGDVYTSNYKRTGRIKKMHLTKYKDWYFGVTLYKDGKRYCKKVHRLIAEAFIPNLGNKPCVNHKDGNKQNNHVYNLEWCTKSENEKHKYDVLGHTPNTKGKFGKDAVRSKAVLQLKDGIVVAEFCSAKEAQEKTGVLRSCICNCCKGKLKTAKGYQWQYK